MSKIIYLNESDLFKIVKKVLKEQSQCKNFDTNLLNSAAKHIKNDVINYIKKEFDKLMIGNNKKFETLVTFFTGKFIDDVMNKISEKIEYWIFEALKCKFTNWGCDYFKINDWIYDVVNMLVESFDKNILNDVAFKTALQILINRNNIEEYKKDLDYEINYLISKIHTIMTTSLISDLPNKLTNYSNTKGLNGPFCVYGNPYVPSTSDLQKNLGWLKLKGNQILENQLWKF